MHVYLTLRCYCQQDWLISIQIQNTSYAVKLLKSHEIQILIIFNHPVANIIIDIVPTTKNTD